MFARIELPVLLLIGLALFFGTMGARLFQRLRIPQVVGYIVIGVLVGRSGLGIIDAGTVRSLQYFNFFALGIIGFMIGGELHREVFRKYGKQFLVVLLAEGLGAFVLVTGAVFGVAYAAMGRITLAAALAVVLGAIASATAPAATVDVLWEYRSRGILTTTVFAIVALDDGLALLLYAVASSVASGLLGHGGVGLAESVGKIVYELAGAVGVGVAGGLLLNAVLRWSRDPDKALTTILGVLASVVGIAIWADMDLILAAMALGVTVANLAPRRSKRTFEILERFAPPLYVLFFVIVGARLDLQGMPVWMLGMAAAYVVARTAGKMAGAWLGARLSGAAESVRRYLGLCLFSQAGVAIGLSILASMSFPPEVGQAVILIVTTTTFLVQIIGPPAVKYAIEKAGEVGLNVTEEHLVSEYTAGDMMDAEAPVFEAATPVPRILERIAESDAAAYPVVGKDGKVLGIVTLQDLKATFGAGRAADWLVAYDVMRKLPDMVSKDTPLEEALTRMREQHLDCLVVVEGREDRRYAGLLELAAVNRRLAQEVIRRRRQAGEED